MASSAILDTVMTLGLLLGYLEDKNATISYSQENGFLQGEMVGSDPCQGDMCFPCLEQTTSEQTTSEQTTSEQTTSADDFRADDFRADDFRADDFRADDFRADDFRADDFRADDSKSKSKK
ncbi:hypothetical protein Bpfe_025458 [Biomphalaria pfeifferi]|uniref:Uncharacterized protein n=1 Tax=Biomphalaria pfeifferi TaxID=112525 RepID=A0AAD8B1X3_BIOPF|nr:hypothetical protein Bpfe_025458 [Biomphalaria pfeifferi]